MRHPRTTARPTLDRRQFLARSTGAALAMAGAGLPLVSCAPPPSIDYGPLQAPDANGLMLPAGFTSRIVAVTGQAVGSTGYVWHTAPDGGATFATPGGGWIYVSNSEWLASLGAGASMIRFDAAGTIVDARRILGGTNINCAGGPTPWGTWLSCEELDTGRVWECDPYGVNAAVVRPAMGTFKHEAAAVDATRGQVYLTEDRPDGAFYRFTPTAYPDLSAGVLEVMTESAGAIGWAVVPDPTAAVTPTRNQVATVKRFNGGEGIWATPELISFTTKGDNRVWVYAPRLNTLAIAYDDDTSATPVLTGVDNLVGGPQPPLLFVAEDGGDMQIVAVNPLDGTAKPFLQITGRSGSEVTGPAFSPDNTRLYFSSQRTPGETFEVTGPFVR